MHITYLGALRRSDPATVQAFDEVATEVLATMVAVNLAKRGDFDTEPPDGWAVFSVSLGDLDPLNKDAEETIRRVRSGPEVPEC